MKDINGDGYDDRITTLCTEGKEKCEAVQVEMGLADGRFIPIYNEEKVKSGEHPEKDDEIFYSPSYYLAADAHACTPDEPAVCNPAVPLMESSEEVKARSKTEAPDEDFIRKYGGKRSNFVPSKSLITTEDIYSKFYFERGGIRSKKLKENVLIEAKMGKSDNILEYFYAEQSGAIDKKTLLAAIKRFGTKLIDELINRKTQDPLVFDRLSELLLEEEGGQEYFLAVVQVEEENGFEFVEGYLKMKPMDDRLLDVERLKRMSGQIDDMAKEVVMYQKREMRCELIVRELAAKRPVDFALWAADILAAQLGGAARRNGTLMTTIAKLVEKVASNSEVAGKLLVSLIDDVQKAGQQSMSQNEKWRILLPFVAARIVSPDEKKVSDAKLVTLVQVFPELKAPVLVAIGRRDNILPQTASWLEGALSNAMSEETLAAAVSAAHHLGAKANSFLMNHVGHESSLVRFYVFRALSTPERPSAEIIAAFGQALHDSDPAVVFVAGKSLVDWRLPVVVHFLMQRMRDFRSDPMSKRDDGDVVTKNGNKFMMNGIKTALLRMRIDSMNNMYQVAIPIEIGEDENEENPPTLKRLALYAAQRVSLPINTAMFYEMLNEEDDPIDLQLLAQVIVELDGEPGLTKLLDRIDQREVPDHVMIFAGGEVIKNKAKKLIPRIFKYLMHPNPAVRNAIAHDIDASGDVKALAAVIEFSKNKDETMRARMAEVLRAFGHSLAKKRLKEMLKDPSPVVRAQAAIQTTDHRPQTTD